MCGIFGITNFSNEKAALAALKTFAYRGPDHTGFTFEDGVFFGNNRLSVIDTDSRSNQPLFSDDTTVSIVFNGEIFNYQELKQELITQGCIFHTTSDTEVVLKLYEYYGENFSSKLRGMYAIAIFDKNINKIFLYKDHVGIKPLYYCLSEGRLLFSSELKGITAIVKNSALSRQAFIFASTLGFVPSPYTIYENIFKLEAGAMLVYDLDEKTYILKKDCFQYIQSSVKSVSDLSELIEQKVLSHLVSDVPVGLFFSGGTDSSLIAAILKKHNISLKTYSIIMGNKNEDAQYIDTIGNYLGLTPLKVNFGVEEFDTALISTRKRIDEPTLDSSLLAIYHISKIAAGDVKVVLSGEGADEFFFGYKRHKALASMTHSYNKSHPVLNFLYTQKLLTKGKRKIFLALYKFLRDPYSYYLTATADRYNTQGWQEWKDLFAERKILPLHLDQEIYLENDLLRKIDLATSYASIEGRVPFLDPDIISASRNFYDTFNLSPMLKPTLKSVLAEYLPHEMVYRGKSGLGLQVKKIFAESKEFKKDLYEALAYLVQQKCFDGLLPEDSVEELIEKEPNYAFLLLTYFYTIINTK